MARRCRTSNHSLSDVHLDPLHYCGKGNIRNKLEEYYTLHFDSHGYNLLNDMEAVFLN